MTEKISRRGVKTPDSYEPDILEKVTVGEVMQPPGIVVRSDNTIEDVLGSLGTNQPHPEYIIISDPGGHYKGLLKCSDLYNRKYETGTIISSIVTQKYFSVDDDNTLRRAVEKMAAGNVEALPVTCGNNTIAGIITFPDIMAAYRKNSALHGKNNPVISLKRRSLKVILKGQKIFGSRKG